MLTLSRISKRYDTTVLDGVSLDVAAGDSIAVIGASGCGKSTLLRIVNGLVAPDAGSVHIDGQPMTSDTARKLRRRIGYVVQGGGLFPHLTAAGNVTLAARVFGWPGDKIAKRISELAELVRLTTAQLDRKPDELSGGQNQRVAVMRALMLDPDLLLMDEPLAGLDPMVRASLQRELRELFVRLAKTVVFVTHDLVEADVVADRIALLDSGKIVQQGTLRELVESPATRFVGDFVQAYRVPSVLADR